MKRIIAVALFAASSLLTVGSAFAQEQKLTAKVPFDFTMNDRLLPAGTYTISKPTPNTIMVVGEKGNTAAVSSAYSNGKASGQSVLVFQRYGDQYFLSKIEATSSVMNLTIPRSKAEQRVRTREASLRQSSQTLVALK